MFSVCESLVLYIYSIYSAQPRLLVSLGTRPVCPRPTGTKQPKPTRRPSKVIAGWCYGDPTWCTLPSICLLSDSKHSLQLRHSIPECNDLSQFREETGGPSVPVREINLIAYLPLVQPTDNLCRDPDLIPGLCRSPAR